MAHATNIGQIRGTAMECHGRDGSASGKCETGAGTTRDDDAIASMEGRGGAVVARLRHGGMFNPRVSAIW